MSDRPERDRGNGTHRKGDLSLPSDEALEVRYANLQTPAVRMMGGQVSQCKQDKQDANRRSMLHKQSCSVSTIDTSRNAFQKQQVQ